MLFLRRARMHLRPVLNIYVVCFTHGHMSQRAKDVCTFRRHGVWFIQFLSLVMRRRDFICILVFLTRFHLCCVAYDG